LVAVHPLFLQAMLYQLKALQRLQILLAAALKRSLAAAQALPFLRLESLQFRAARRSLFSLLKEELQKLLACPIWRYVQLVPLTHPQANSHFHISPKGGIKNQSIFLTGSY
jgi:hypothetical protein